MTQSRGNSEPLVDLSPELGERYPEISEPLIDELYKRVHMQKTLEHFQALWDERRFVFRAIVLGSLIFAVIAFLIPKRYQSTTRLMPPDNQSNSGLSMLAAINGSKMGALGGIAGDILGLKTSGDLFIGILGSNSVEDHIIQEFDLQKLYGARTIEAARRALSERTGISEDRKSGIITISVIDRSPERAAAMAQEYAAELNRVVNQLNTSASHRERVFLEERLQQVKQELQSAERDFGEFASKNTAIDIKEQGRAMFEAAATLQGQLIAAESELQGLKQIYADGNVRVQAVQARVAEIRKQLDKLGGENTTTPNLPAGDSLYPSIRKLPLLGVSYADLYRRTKVQEAIFETLTQEYELAKVAEAKETPSVKVLDPAGVPQEKSSPHRLPIIFAGALSAFALAAGYVVLRASWQRIDIRDPWKVFASQVFQAIRARLSVLGRGKVARIPRDKLVPMPAPTISSGTNSTTASDSISEP